MDSRLSGGGFFPSVFPRAAFTFASCAAARSSAATSVDLDLTGLDRGYAVEFVEDVSGPDLAPIDMSASPAPLSRNVSPPAVGSRSTEQESFRRESLPAVQSASVAGATPGTVCTY